MTNILLWYLLLASIGSVIVNIAYLEGWNPERSSSGWLAFSLMVSVAIAIVTVLVIVGRLS